MQVYGFSWVLKQLSEWVDCAFSWVLQKCTNLFECAAGSVSRVLLNFTDFIVRAVNVISWILKQSMLPVSIFQGLTEMYFHV